MTKKKHDEERRKKYDERDDNDDKKKIKIRACEKKENFFISGIGKKQRSYPSLPMALFKN